MMVVAMIGSRGWNFWPQFGSYFGLSQAFMTILHAHGLTDT